MTKSLKGVRHIEDNAQDKDYYEQPENTIVLQIVNFYGKVIHKI